jgi:hypothetical protein
MVSSYLVIALRTYSGTRPIPPRTWAVLAARFFTSIISNFTYDSDFSNIFSAAPANTDVFSFLLQALLDVSIY